MGYFKDAARGVSWSAALRITIRVISILKLAILARLLLPDQFGLFGIATITLALLEVFLETGVNIFLIQEKSDIKKYIDSAWVVSIVRGIIMSAILIIASPFISSFFRNPEALGVLLAISLVPLLRGFINPSIVYFHKDVKFHKEFLYRTVLFAIDAIVTVALALLTHSVYSMVVGVIIAVIFEIIISFRFATPRPKLSFNPDYIKLIFHRGKWVTLFGVFGFIAQEGDTVAVGRLMNTAALGEYNLAYKIAVLPIEAKDAISPVVFPVYVKISHDMARLWRAFVKTTGITILITGSVCAVLYFFTYPIVSIFLGNNWLAIIPVVKLLVIYGLLRAIFESVTSLFLAIEKQRYITLMTLVRVTGLLVTIVPAITMWGLIGAAYSVIFSIVIEIPLIVYLVYRVFTRPAIVKAV